MNNRTTETIKALRDALTEIYDSIPACDNGMFFTEHFTPDGEQMGVQQHDPVAIVGHISELARRAIALTADASPKPRIKGWKERQHADDRALHRDVFMQQEIAEWRAAFGGDASEDAYDPMDEINNILKVALAVATEKVVDESASGEQPEDYCTGKFAGLRTMLTCILATLDAVKIAPPAARPAPVGAVQAPEGWQLVPKEPTEEMRCACLVMDYQDDIDSEWTRMLAAAPAAPIANPGQREQCAQAALNIGLFGKAHADDLWLFWQAAQDANGAPVEHIKMAEGPSERFDAFMLWAREWMGQGYSLEFEDGSFVDPVTRWAFKGYKAGIIRGQQAGAVDGRGDADHS